MGLDLFARCRNGPEFRALSKLAFISLDLRYARSENICGQDLYGGEGDAWLHQEAHAGLCLCGPELQRRHPGFKLRVFDAARPLSVQRKLFAKVAGTPQQAYVADPERGSVHNYGFALDLSLQDEQGQALDLGTDFDSFDPLAQPQLEAAFLAQERLSGQQIAWRSVLKDVMAAGGYQQHAMEWWHFEFKPLEALRQKYPLLDA